MSDFSRNPQGERFNFRGMKTNDVADALAPGKYPVAVNVRGTDDNDIITRPGYPATFSTLATAGKYISDMRAYTALNTDNNPRVLFYDQGGNVWLDTGANVGTLTVGAPITQPLGAAMIPFRPNQSPTPWMYIANGDDYQKFSAPPVTQQKVGIAEPQAAPDAGVWPYNNGVFGSANPGWTNGGTAGAVANGTRISDTVVAVFRDPNTNTVLYSVQVATSVQYQKFMLLTFAGNTNIVLDVFPPITTAINISAIRYFSGSTGRCILVPSNLGVGPGLEGQSIYAQNLLASLRRGSLLKFSGGGAEVVYVWSVTEGPNGTIAIETSTTVNHTAAETLTSVPAIQVAGGTPAATQAIAAADVTYQVTAGVGTQTASISNPFASSGVSFQPGDFIILGILIDNLSNLTEMKFLLDVGDGSFTQNFYYYTVRPSDVAAAVANSATQLATAQTADQRKQIDAELTAIAQGAGGLSLSSGTQTPPGSSQWAEIVFPISALVRVGNDQTKSLQNVSKMQVLWNASGTINVATDQFMLEGGFQPDVGSVGQPYLYRVRPRSSTTGVKGNPSPPTRYGVSARRAQVAVALPSASYDTQIDTWDVFRFGGAVLSWRYITSVPSSAAFVFDNFSDDTALAGEELEFDNFEPWPTIDVPNNGTASVVNGTVAVITSTNTNTNNYLPGTLVRLGGTNVYTLWKRPVILGANVYLLEFVENAGAGTSVSYQIDEPILAHQFQPYMWGPDAKGTIFAVGDPLRPGTVSFAKNYAPDSVPDKYNLEISTPSEPLLGGEILDGLSFVASTEQWWALYPQPQDPLQRYAVVKQPLTRGLAAPYGHCNDGTSIYWWAKDGIYSSSKGSLTDDDLYNLFPHEGIAAQNIVYGPIAGPTTIYAPDYSRAGTFRLEYSNGFLYAIYQDSTGVYRMLVLDLKRMAWCVDTPATSFISSIYHVEQPESTLNSSGTLYPMLLAAMATGIGSFSVVPCVQKANTNDAQGTIPVTLYTRELDGGDARAPKQWGDVFLDSVSRAPAGIVVNPISVASGIVGANTTTIAVNPNRQRTPIDLGPGPSNKTVVSDFLGLQLTWTDDYTQQVLPTKLILWQPSFAIQPAPESGFITFGTSFGLSGYMHIREIVIAWVSNVAINLTITSFDGISPNTIQIPSSGGIYKKQVFPVSANKGQLYKFHFSTATPPLTFQLFMDDCEVRVGSWGRTTPYLIAKDFGGNNVRGAVL